MTSTPRPTAMPATVAASFVRRLPRDGRRARWETRIVRMNLAVGSFQLVTGAMVASHQDAPPAVDGWALAGWSREQQ